MLCIRLHPSFFRTSGWILCATLFGNQHEECIRMGANPGCKRVYNLVQQWFLKIVGGFMTTHLLYLKPVMREQLWCRSVHNIAQGLVKMFNLLPRNFFVLNGSVLKISMDIHTKDIHITYTGEIQCFDTFAIFFACDIRSKERFVCFGAPETVNILKYLHAN